MDILLIAVQAVINRERVLRDPINPLDIPENDIFDRFRFPRHLIMDIAALLRPLLIRPTRRSRALPSEIQVCIALRYYATGSFQNVTADTVGITKATVSRALRDVSRGLARNANRFIKFSSAASVQLLFSEIAGLPRVVGVIDCTHVAIRRPHINEHVYVNRKNFHSINVQAICDAKMRFTNVVVLWPGSTHDSFVWEQCAIKNQFLNGEHGDGYLIGDSGYALRPYLITPLPEPIDLRERNFNFAIKRTRVLIECAFGILKSRFRCLDKSGGSMQLYASKASTVIQACLVLHNLALDRNVPLPHEVIINHAVINEQANQIEPIAPGDDSHRGGRQARQQIIELM